MRSLCTSAADAGIAPEREGDCPPPVLGPPPTGGSPALACPRRQALVKFRSGATPEEQERALGRGPSEPVKVVVPPNMPGSGDSATLLVRFPASAGRSSAKAARRLADDPAVEYVEARAGCWARGCWASRCPSAGAARRRAAHTAAASPTPLPRSPTCWCLLMPRPTTPTSPLASCGACAPAALPGAHAAAGWLASRPAARCRRLERCPEQRPSGRLPGCPAATPPCPPCPAPPLPPLLPSQVRRCVAPGQPLWLPGR